MTNKIDVMRLSELPSETQAIVNDIFTSDPTVKLVEVSCHSDEGVMELKTAACDALLAHRIETKMKGNKVNSIINRIHVAQPKARDEVERPPFIPEAVKERKKHDKNDADRRRLLRDREAEEGGAGVFNINLKGMLCHFVMECHVDMIVQRIISLKTLNGSRTLYLRLWMERILRTLLTLILLRSLKPLSVKRSV